MLKMNICFKFKPFAVSCNENLENIYDFDQDEQDLVYDVFVRIVRNFKQVYEDVDIIIRKENDLVYINICADKLSEEEFEYFVDILTGHQEDNVIFFDDNEFVIRGKIQEDKQTTLDRFNDLVQDLTPELMKIT